MADAHQNYVRQAEEIHYLLGQDDVTVRASCVLIRPASVSWVERLRNLCSRAAPVMRECLCPCLPLSSSQANLADWTSIHVDEYLNALWIGAGPLRNGPYNIQLPPRRLILDPRAIQKEATLYRVSPVPSNDEDQDSNGEASPPASHSTRAKHSFDHRFTTPPKPYAVQPESSASTTIPCHLYLAASSLVRRSPRRRCLDRVSLDHT